MNKKDDLHSGLGNLFNVRQDLFDSIKPSQANEDLLCHDRPLHVTFEA